MAKMAIEQAKSSHGERVMEERSMTVIEILGRAIEQDPIPVLGILLGCGAGALIVCTAIIAKTWRSVRVTDAEAALKQQMLDRGMSAEEIERVMKAGERRGA